MKHSHWTSWTVLRLRHQRHCVLEHQLDAGSAQTCPTNIPKHINIQTQIQIFQNISIYKYKYKFKCKSTNTNINAKVQIQIDCVLEHEFYAGLLQTCPTNILNPPRQGVGETLIQNIENITIVLPFCSIVWLYLVLMIIFFIIL